MILTRRSILTGLIAAPIVVRAGLIMLVRTIPVIGVDLALAQGDETYDAVITPGLIHKMGLMNGHVLIKYEDQKSRLISPFDVYFTN